MLEARPTSCTRSLHVARPARQLLARRRFPHAVKTGFGCPMAPTSSFSHEIPFHYQNYWPIEKSLSQAVLEFHSSDGTSVSLASVSQRLGCELPTGANLRRI
jgi:hypothetical protein